MCTKKINSPRDYSDMGLNTHLRNCFILAGPDIDGLCKPDVQTFSFPFFFLFLSILIFSLPPRITHCKNWQPAYHLKVKKTSWFNIWAGIFFLSSVNNWTICSVMGNMKAVIEYHLRNLVFNYCSLLAGIEISFKYLVYIVYINA